MTFDLAQVKCSSIIHTFIHYSLGASFSKRPWEWEKEVWKFGGLGYYVQVRKNQKKKGKNRRKKQKLIFKEAHL
jgi:hypothetical protein